MNLCMIIHDYAEAFTYLTSYDTPQVQKEAYLPGIREVCLFGSVLFVMVFIC